MSTKTLELQLRARAVGLESMRAAADRIREVESHARSMGATIQRIPTDRFGQMAEQMRRAETHASALSASMSRMPIDKLNQVGAAMTIGLTVPLVAFARSSVQAAVSLDSLTRGLAAVSKSAEPVGVQLARLKEVAKLPGLNFEDAVRGSIKLQAAGLSAQTAEKALREFGNALATVGGGSAELDGVSTALAQIASKSIVSAEEIGQLAERIPQIRVLMQQAFGTGSGEEITKMGIEPKQFIERILEVMEKAPRVAGGAQRSFEDFSEALREMQVSVGQAALPILTDFLKSATPLVENLARGLATLQPEVRSVAIGLAALAAAAGPAMLAFTQTATLLQSAAALRSVASAATAAGTALAGARTAAAVGTTAGIGTTTATTAAGIGATLGSTTPALAAAPVAAGVAGAAGVGILGAIGLAAVIPALWMGDQLNRTNEDATQNELGYRRMAYDPKTTGGFQAVGLKRRLASVRARGGAGSPLEAMILKQLGELKPGPGSKAAEEEQAARKAPAQDYETVRRDFDLASQRAQGQGRSEMPVLQARQGRLLQIARSVHELNAKDRADGNKEPNAAREKLLVELETDYWQTQSRITDIRKQRADLAKRSADDVIQKRRELAQKAKQTAESHRQAIDARMEAQIDTAPEGQQAAAAFAIQTPELRRRQAELDAQARKAAQGSTEYYQAVTEYWQIENRIGQLAQAATQERGRAMDEARRANEKALQDAGRQVQDQQRAAGIRVRLVQARIGNIPGLSRQQKRAAVVSAMQEQLASISQAVPGESRTDAMERALQAEELKGQILGVAFGNRRGSAQQRRAALSQLDQVQADGMRRSAPVYAPQISMPINVSLDVAQSDRRTLELVDGRLSMVLAQLRAGIRDRQGGG